MAARDIQREIDLYWSGEAARAYAERVREVEGALLANGGKIEPWMIFNIMPADLRQLISSPRP